MNNYWQEKCIPIPPTGISRANKISHWNNGDSEEKFLKNPRPGFTKESIIYRYNSKGYRTTEFNFEDPAVICLGCSLTEGTGVNYEDTWVSKLEKHFLNYNVYNLGVEGVSNDSITRTLYNVSGLFNIDLVFILWTLNGRSEIYHPDRIQPTYPSTEGAFARLTVEETHLYNLQQRNLAMVNLLEKTHGYRVINCDCTAIDFKSEYDFGRDDHPGPGWHNEVANLFLHKYQHESTQ
jgi:hypothetical protein